uniref:Uncharacterized protein n=1 Tax=Hucho hucho TaxID=62062 RepID=A0A4W5MYX8_9TELE
RTQTGTSAQRVRHTQSKALKLELNLVTLDEWRCSILSGLSDVRSLCVSCDRGFLRSDKPIGTAHIKLEKLETESEVREIVEVIDGRKPTGGRVEVRVRLREPLSGQDLQTTTERWLVLDQSQVNATERWLVLDQSQVNATERWLVLDQSQVNATERWLVLDQSQVRATERWLVLDQSQVNATERWLVLDQSQVNATERWLVLDQSQAHIICNNCYIWSKEFGP